MAATISWQTLRQLAEFQAVQGCAISLYVDLDPSDTPTAGDASTRVRSLLDGLRTSHGDRATLTHDQREALRNDVERIRRWFENDFDRDGARGVAVFCSGLDNMWRTLSLPESVYDAVSVGREALLTPLVPLVGRGSGAIVAVVSREQGRLYRLSGGRLEEVADLFEDQPGQHDQGGWSQARFQRHIEKLVHEHMKAVAGEIGQQARRARSARVVIVCPQELRGDFESALPADVRDAIVGWAQAQAQAGPAELLEVVLPELERADAEDEAELIGRWREEAGRDARAASGWAQTLEAASAARVDVLLFTQGVTHDAWQCPACGRVSVSGGQCPLDGTEMEHREQGLDLAVHHTLGHGGRVRALRNRQDLDPVEGIG
ncbi:MAG: baeRF10 domain-containing protein, partial [Gaiellaceae bacterium]